MAAVLVVGSYNLDQVWRCPELPAPGATALGHYQRGPGGKGFNQALAAHRFGADTFFITALGEDAAGRDARDRFAEVGLRALAVAVADQATGTAAVLVGEDGSNLIAVAAGANGALDGTRVAAQSALFRGARVLLCQWEIDPEGTLAALQLGREVGALTLLNPAPAPTILPAEALAAVDVLTPNETEFIALARMHGLPDPSPLLKPLDPQALHALCRQLPVPLIIITLGEQGALVSHSDPGRWGDRAPVYLVPPPYTLARDTTGAGDAFNGALAALLASDDDRPLAQRVLSACRYAALSTEREGAAEALPTLQEWLQRYPQEAELE